MAYNKWLYFIDGEDEEEAENEQENEVTVPAITPKKRRAQFIEIPQSVVKTANQDMNLSEKLLVESASERDRISEVSLDFVTTVKMSIPTAYFFPCGK